MARFKQNFLVLAVLAVLAIAGTLMDSARNSARAAGATPALSGPPPVPVNVVSAPAVTGTVAATESGTWNVNAAQKGTWNVGITGQPVSVTGNVGITGQPVSVTGNVGITGQPVGVHITDASVPVAFSTSSPLLIQNAEEPGRVPYQESFSTDHPPCLAWGCSLGFTFSTVPDGKRLVIKNVNALLNMNTGGVLTGAALSVGTNNVNVYFPFTTRYLNFAGLDQWVVQQEVLLYVDAESHPFFWFTTDPDHGASSGGTVTLTGYYVSVP